MAINDTYNISSLPSIDIPRSRFDKSFSHKTTFNVGDLIPIFVDEILPASTISINTSKLVRLQTLLYPIMDNLYLDTYFFFVPTRLVWSHWINFMGEKEDTSGYVDPTDYEVPMIQINTSGKGFPVGSVADYMGIPVNTNGAYVNALPFRAYAKCWNEYFRDQNLTDPVQINTGDEDTIISDNYINNFGSNNYRITGAYGLEPLKASKYRDVFTTALPWPQKGDTVTLPLATESLPVGTQPATHTYNSGFLKFGTGPSVPTTQAANLVYNGSDRTLKVDLNSATATSGRSYYGTYPTNLYADVSNASVNINDLRIALATQRLLEKDALYGTRYFELLQGHFSVTSPDSRLQRPEFIGGSHFALNIDQVVQQSQTTNDSILGETGAYSVSAHSDDEVQYSSVEHGYIIGLAVARYEHSYQQGLDKMWTRRHRLDYYWPELSRIGMVGIKNQEIRYIGNNGPAPQTNNLVWGYQEAYYDYRTKKNIVSSEMHSGIDNTLDSWHLADYYSNTPVLGDDWIREDKNNINRVIAVSDSNANQILADFYFDYKAVLPMPAYSTPGLADIR